MTDVLMGETRGDKCPSGMLLSWLYMHSAKIKKHIRLEDKLRQLPVKLSTIHL